MPSEHDNRISIDEYEPLLGSIPVEDITTPDVTWHAFAVQTKGLFDLAWPVSITNLLQFSITSSCILFMGHLSTEYLASAALAIMLINVTGSCIAQGTATALDTFCSQAYTGSSDSTALGKHLQRGLVVSFIFCIPISLLWLNAESMLLLLGQSPKIAQLAGTYCKWSIPGLYPMFVNECLRRYLQSQGIMKPGMYVTFVSAILAVSLQWLLVWSHYSIGYIGGPVAAMLVNLFMPISLSLFVAFGKGSKQWGGFSVTDTFNGAELWKFIQLSVPGILMTSTEWFAFEAMAICAGILGTEVLAAQTVILNTATLMFTIPFGIAISTTTRVGNSLGADNPKLAKQITKTALVLALIAAAFNSIIILAFKRHIGMIFSNDPKVVSLVESVFPILAIYQIYDTTGAIGGAVMRGCGLQKWGAYINTLSYFMLT